MISLNWVKDYIDLSGEDLKELAVKVTKAGVNVEKVVNAVKKSATRMMISFSDEDTKRICDFVNKNVSDMQKNEISIWDNGARIKIDKNFCCLCKTTEQLGELQPSLSKTSR